MLYSLSVSDIVLIIAVLLAPMLAVQAQKRLDAMKEHRREKDWVFRSLMATRDARVSPEHIRALNSIELVFFGHKVFRWHVQKRSEKNVINAWREYSDLLNQRPAEEQLPVWIDKGDDLFTELLHYISRECGYNFDKVTLKRSIYSPRAQGERERDMNDIRSRTAQIMRGEWALPVMSYPPPPQTGDQQTKEMRVDAEEPERDPLEVAEPAENQGRESE